MPSGRALSDCDGTASSDTRQRKCIASRFQIAIFLLGDRPAQWPAAAFGPLGE